MNKSDSLRAAIEAAFPVECRRNPDRLHVFVDKGRIAARHGAEEDFEYRYKLAVILTDFAGDVDLLMATVLTWLRVHQPSRLQNHDQGNEAFGFEAVILDPKKADVEITIDIEEAVAVRRDAQGAFVFTHPPEPVLAGLDDAEAAIQQIIAGGEQLYPAP
ncbi:phage tail protein [Novosphingopyxis sp. YJ-S2-01]|uniref:phage tail protein n=1 Tax=Novosphingopyxis sp. YJ-S2-01 TaxID=2794021 RepID=UPI0018DE7A51|nr:phage tail protein [Novosphingopyxis sp. YJ-S2-01]MBH9536929.1 phage tail protein [Novosphingopyxis sp. YJ-S2-01]